MIGTGALVVSVTGVNYGLVWPVGTLGARGDSRARDRVSYISSILLLAAFAALAARKTSGTQGSQ